MKLQIANALKILHIHYKLIKPKTVSEKMFPTQDSNPRPIYETICCYKYIYFKRNKNRLVELLLAFIATKKGLNYL